MIYGNKIVFGDIIIPVNKVTRSIPGFQKLIISGNCVNNDYEIDNFLPLLHVLESYAMRINYYMRLN